MCYKKTDDKCRFNIPYWPMDTTRILIPMSLDDGRRTGYKKKASKMRRYLELKMCDTMKAFCEDHNVEDLEEYLNIFRGSISRPLVMIKWQMTEL
jgi:predicted house-cleaning noncanonical NTP pyrophosphatase (MazG superfamily)